MSMIAYLDAAARTQDLLNVKWILRSAGYVIGSNWHDETEYCPSLRGHWHGSQMEQIGHCDLLVVVVCGQSAEALLELALEAGFALARGIDVVWIGPLVQVLGDFSRVRHFRGVDEFREALTAGQKLVFKAPENPPLGIEMATCSTAA